MVKAVHLLVGILVGIALIQLCACTEQVGEQIGEQRSAVVATGSQLFWAENAGSAPRDLSCPSSLFPS